MAFTVIWYGIHGVVDQAIFPAEKTAKDHAISMFKARKRDDGIVSVQVRKDNGAVVFSYAENEKPGLGATEESMVKRQQDEHEFMVAGVEIAAGKMIQGIAITLIDARGGRVRLHLTTDMAELLRERVSGALNKMQGP